MKNIWTRSLSPRWEAGLEINNCEIELLITVLERHLRSMELFQETDELTRVRDLLHQLESIKDKHETKDDSTK